MIIHVLVSTKNSGHQCCSKARAADSGMQACACTLRILTQNSTDQTVVLHGGLVTYAQVPIKSRYAVEIQDVTAQASAHVPYPHCDTGNTSALKPCFSIIVPQTPLTFPPEALVGSL